MSTLSRVVLGTFVLLAIVSLAANVAEAQGTRQGRQRGNSNRSRQKGKDQCHGKEIDKCYEQLQALSKADRPADIIKTKDGLDKLCK